MTKYCGYEIGVDITCEQVEKLMQFLQANYTHQELIMMDQETINRRASESEAEWRR